MSICWLQLTLKRDGLLRQSPLLRKQFRWRKAQELTPRRFAGGWTFINSDRLFERHKMEKATIQLDEAQNVQTWGSVACTLKLLRFKDWSVQNGVFLLGAFFSENFLNHTPAFIVASLLLSCLCLAYGYSLNEFFDDLKEKISNDRALAASLHRFIYWLLSAALIVAWLISLLAFVNVILIGITVWLHSSPPFRLKQRLFWRLFLNSLGFGLFFLAGASLDNQLSRGEVLMGIFIFGLYLPLELIHVLAHMDADRSKDLKTFALVHGETKTIRLGLILLGLLICYHAVLWKMSFVPAAVAGWSAFTLALLFASLVSFRQRGDRIEAYRKLRVHAKIVCAVYGIGTLAILVGKSWQV